MSEYQVKKLRNFCTVKISFLTGTRFIRVPSGGVPMSSGCVLLTSACVRIRPLASADVHRSAFPVHRTILNLIFI